MPDEMGAAGSRVQPSQRVLGDRRVVLDRGQQPRERRAGRPLVRRRQRAAARAAGVVGHVGRRPRYSRGVALARMKSATSRMVVPGPNTAATPSALSGSTSSSGMIPPTVTRTSSRPFSLSCAADARHERHVRARQDRQADDVDVLLERRGHDHLRRLAEARVDDLEALVAQAPREHLRPAVVAVEAGLRDQHLERSVGHATIIGGPTCMLGRQFGGPFRQYGRRRDTARESGSNPAARRGRGAPCHDSGPSPALGADATAFELAIEQPDLGLPRKAASASCSCHGTLASRRSILSSAASTLPDDGVN